MPDADDELPSMSDPTSTSTSKEIELYREPEPAPALVSVGSRLSRISHVQRVLIGGLAVMVVLSGLTGWLGFRSYQEVQLQHLQQLLIQAGRQGATNLTTIDYEHADADVQRILDSSTDNFHDDFANRAQPFTDVVKQAQSKSVGTVIEAGLETMAGNEGRVLVAIIVKTSNRGAEQPMRAWRMRLTVKKVSDDEAKISRVEFIP